MKIGLQLLDNAETLTDTIMHQIWERVPGYASPWISREDLAAGVLNTTVGVLRAFVGLEEGLSPQLKTAHEVGAARALQGVSLGSVIETFRRMERTLSEAVVSSSEGLTVSELRRDLRRLASAFDELSSGAIASYQDVQTSLSAQIGRLSSGFVNSLMSGNIGGDEIAEGALLLELDLEGTYHAFALHIGGDVTAQRRAEFQRRALHGLPARRSTSTLMSTLQDYDVFIVPAVVGPATIRGITDSLFQESRYPVWLSLGTPCVGLRNAGLSAYQAVEAMRVAVLTRAPHTVTSFDDVLLDVLLLHSDAVTSRLLTTRYEPLIAHPQLLETLDAFLLENMSIKATAERLFVHTNTVSYRLRQIQALTDLDPRDPLELVRMALASQGNVLRNATSRRHDALS